MDKQGQRGFQGTVQVCDLGSGERGMVLLGEQREQLSEGRRGGLQPRDQRIRRCQAIWGTRPCGVGSLEACGTLI